MQKMNIVSVVLYLYEIYDEISEVEDFYNKRSSRIEAKFCRFYKIAGNIS